MAFVVCHIQPRHCQELSADALGILIKGNRLLHGLSALELD